MSDVQVEKEKGFSWMCLLFAPYYYAGYGKFQKGLIFSVIGFIPLTSIVVNIYAGVKAKKELPIGKQDFKWVSAVVIFLIHTTITLTVFSFSPQFEKEMNATKLDEISGVWRREEVSELITINIDSKDKYLIISERKIPVQIHSIDTDNDIVSFNINFNNKTVIWTLRQIWTDDGFTLNLVLHDGKQEELSFIRNVD